jgi:prepilin-type processing-associated H-X9-DG protein/prepilin-type N-terminal cleavage/methylation domain-containing protein
MRKRAFTLVEILIAVSVIALLVTVLVPGLSAARSMARSAKCKHRLSQINAACRATADPNIGVLKADTAAPFPSPNEWPAGPMRAVGSEGIFQCPERPMVYHSINDYYIHTNYGGGIDIPFEENRQTGLCRVIEDTDDYTLFGFEDGNVKDLWSGTIDIYIKITKGIPPTGIHMSDHYQGYESSPKGVLSLMRAGEVIPGWEDFRNVAKGETFQLSSGATSYGLNAACYRPDLPAHTVAVLDYPERVANTGPDVARIDDNLRTASERHRGKLNVLFADGSVGTYGPTEISPNLSKANAERWSPP